MRTNLFLSTLFAVSLLGGAAMAGKPGGERPVREPRAIENLRSHGDMVDKSYRTNDPKANHSRVTDASAQKTQQQRTARPNDRASSRINCSDTGADCGTSSRSTVRPDARSAPSAPSAQASKAPTPSAGNERMNCNEADECSVSSKGARKAWAQNNGGNSPTEKPGASRSLDQRTIMQPSDSRMSCNEADECMMSSKDAKKIWAIESVKAGTFNGAANAAAEKDAQQKAQQEQAQKAKEQQAKK